MDAVLDQFQRLTGRRGLQNPIPQIAQGFAGNRANAIIIFNNEDEFTVYHSGRSWLGFLDITNISWQIDLDGGANTRLRIDFDVTAGLTNKPINLA